MAKQTHRDAGVGNISTRLSRDGTTRHACSRRARHWEFGANWELTRRRDSRPLSAVCVDELGCRGHLEDKAASANLEGEVAAVSADLRRVRAEVAWESGDQ